MSQIKNNPVAGLSLVPEKKLQWGLRKVIDSYPEYKDWSLENTFSIECEARIEAIYRYVEANIPVDYWFLNMKDFKGDKILYKKYNEIVSDIDKQYNDGLRICIAGRHGVGKTFTAASILKRSVEKGFSSLYLTLTDIINIMISKNQSEKTLAREGLLKVDFLVIDEFDSRFMGSDGASDLYGRIIEPTLRHRLQNKLPIIISTNNLDIVSSFNGPLKDSIGSLMKLFNKLPVLGSDFRGSL
jgi:DNA replication protein DnaC